MLRSFTIALLMSSGAYAADINNNPLVVHAFIQNANVPPGAAIPVRIQLELDPHYHAYKQQFDLRVVKPEGATATPFELKPIVKFFDKVSNSTKEGIHEHGDMFFNLALPSKVVEGPQTAEFEIRFQACADDHCLFPKKVKASANFTVVAHSVAPPSSEISSWDIATALDQRSWHAFLLVFLFGILTSFTPCIFPMIPITLAVIGARAIGQPKTETSNRFSFRGLTLGIFYVLGIALTYALLGLFAAKTGALFGAFLGSPVVVISIAIIFVLMGLSMYGLFDIQVPAFIRDTIGAKHTNRGFGGAFVSGLIAGVVAGPCVGPILVTVLTFVARSQNMFLGFSLLFTYAVGLGLIFIVLGAFSGMLHMLPRSGSWMDVSKFIFGSSMIALALYYLAPVISTQTLDSLIAVTLVSIGSFYGAFEANAKLSKVGKLRKGLMVLTLFVGLTFAAKAIIFETMIPTKAELKTASEGLLWKKYNEADFDRARSGHKPLILDFSADWCQACKELEHYTYSDSRIQSESSRFQLFSFDATSESAELTQLRQQYGILGLPTLLFFGTDGKIKTELTLTGFESAEQFLERMKKSEL